MNTVTTNDLTTIVNIGFRDHRKTMPMVDVDAIRAEIKKHFGRKAYERTFQNIITIQKGICRIRINKPTHDDGISHFVWRWLAFMLSNNKQHQYIPHGWGEDFLKKSDYKAMNAKKSDYPKTELYSQIRIVKNINDARRIAFMEKYLFPIIDIILQVHFGLENREDATKLRRMTIIQKMKESC